MRSHSLKAVLVPLAAAATSSQAIAQAPPSDGFDWVTIGAPGNRAANAQEAPGWFGYQVGAVDHVYRIARTQVTVSQWLEFVNAYAPYHVGSPSDPAFTSRWIYPTDNGYAMVPGTANFPADMSFHMAARYCNWLQNGRRNAAWAFESGAYDTSTFTVNPDGTRNDQITHTPGTSYWIPSLDEWDKAVYYDPNRYGLGQDGYWLQPNGSNTALIPGLPQDGGQTSGGVETLLNWGIGVESYPTVQTPWGLLDASGGRMQWTESLYDPNDGGRARWLAGSGTGDDDYANWDRLDIDLPSGPSIGSYGVRLASAIPSPGSVSFSIGGALYAIRRKRRCTATTDVAAFVNTWYADLANGTFLADFDHNGAVEPADVSLFVLTWFTQLSAGC